MALSGSSTFVDQAKVLVQRAHREMRSLSPAELGELEALSELARTEREDPVKALGEQLGPPGSFLQAGSFAGGGRPGDTFVQSAGYKQIQHPDGRP